MKTKNNSILFFVFLIATAFYFNSCKPDETPACGNASNTTINLTPDELAKVPYTGFDTLYFKGINGDTNIVVGTGKQFYYDIKYTTHGGPDCPMDVANYQACKIDFNTLKGDLSFTYTQKLLDRKAIITKDNYPVYFILNFDLLGTKSSYNLYSDSMVINGYKYGCVYGALAYNNITDNKDTSYISYINQTNGVLFIKSQKSNEEYSLLKK